MAESKFRAARPLWRQGMLVRPQHMQQQDIYHEQNLDARLQTIAPDAWGVTQISFDHTALRASTNVVVKQFQGVLPDGTVVDFSTITPPPARPVGEVQISERRIGVFLSTPLVQHGVENITSERSTRRYTCIKRSIFDLVDIKTKDSQVENLYSVEPTVVLTIGEPRENHASVQVAELVRGEDGEIAFAPDYIPPLLSIGGSEWLGTQLDKLLSHAITKRRSADTHLRSESVTLRALRLVDVQVMMFCSALDRAIPVLRSLIRDRRSAPRDVYNHVAQLCGELTLPCGGDSTNLPIYSHHDLRSSFSKLFEQLHSQIEVEFGQHFITIPMSDKGNYWAAQDSHLATCGRIFLVLNGGQTKPKEIKQAFCSKAKVASAQRLRDLVQKAVRGLPLTPLERGPDDIPARKGDVFFELDRQHRFWKEIQKDEQIGLFISVKELGPKHIRARLIAVVGEEAT